MKISVEEANRRFRRLDTLRVLTEGYEEGTGFSIYQKALRAENQPEEYFTGIIRLTFLEKDWLGYMLENDMLSDEEVDVIEWYSGCKKNPPEGN